MSDLKRVGFGPRLGAYVIDSIIASVIGTILGYIVAGIGFQSINSSSGLVEAASAGYATVYMTSLVLFLTIFGYYLIEAITGSSLGKKIIGLTICNEDGTTPAQNTLMLRFIIKTGAFILYLFSFLFFMRFNLGIALLFYYIGLAYSLFFVVSCCFAFQDTKQALHDKFIKTAVCKVEDLKQAYR